MDNPELLIIFFMIALLYSSIGFGGGSSYIAILALYGIEYNTLRVLALLCNITVVSFGVYYYGRNGLLPWKKVFPLVLLSVPFAFIGGIINLPKEIFLLVLGFVLIMAGMAIFFKQQMLVREESKSTNSTSLNMAVGGGIGFLSGLVSIGGGIFLSPLLHLLGWDTAKKIAAVASFFILVNSISGLAGRLISIPEAVNWRFGLLLMGAVFLGGQIGTRIGTKLLSELMIRRLTAILICYVGLKLLWENF